MAFIAFSGGGDDGEESSSWPHVTVLWELRARFDYKGTWGG